MKLLIIFKWNDRSAFQVEYYRIVWRLQQMLRTY